MNIRIGDRIPLTIGEYALVEESQLGRLSSTICKCRLGDGRSAYYKIGQGYAKSDIQAETARLKWLEGKLPVPEVLGAGETEEAAWLLISAIAGQPARCSDIHPSILINRLADGLKQIHQVPTAECPFREALAQELIECERRLRNDELNREAFIQGTNGLTPEQTMTELFQNYNLLKDLVFTHGDYGLSNVIFHQEDLVAFIDWGLAGLADLHRDLMTIGDSITRYLGAEWAGRFYQLYGIENVDAARMRYFTLLDQFFVPSVWIPGPLYTTGTRTMLATRESNQTEKRR